MCNFFNYVNNLGQSVTGRTMDAMSTVGADHMSIRLTPKGIAKASNSDNPVTWTSKYNAVAMWSYNGLVFEAMNEKGFTASGLYLVESNYGLLNGRKTLSVPSLCQFAVDSFATVEEVVNYFESEKDNICIVTSSSCVAPYLSNLPVSIHWAFTDAHGDGVAMEFLDGELNFFRFTGVSMAMTNDPNYNKQLTVLEYLRKKSLPLCMPGTAMDADRFMRISGWLEMAHNEPMPEAYCELPEQNATWQKRNFAKSLIHAMNTPHLMDFEENDNNSSTIWSVNCDQNNGWIYLEHLRSFSYIFLEFDKLDFEHGVQELPMYNGITYLGDVSDKFVPVEGDLEFAYVDVNNMDWNNYDPAMKEEVLAARIAKVGF